MGIRTKFISIIGVLSLLTTIAIGYSSYMFRRQNDLADAKSKKQEMVKKMIDFIKGPGRELIASPQAPAK